MNTSHVGGAENVAINIMSKLHEWQIPVVVITGNKGLLFHEMTNYAEVHHIPNPTTEDLQNILADCTVVVNNNWWNICPTIAPVIESCGFKYMAAIHGPFIPYLSRIAQYDNIVHEYLSFSPLGSKILTVDFNVSPRKIRQQRIPVKKPLVRKTKAMNDLARQFLNVSASAHVVGMVSRISPEKGILDALDIFEMYHMLREDSVFVIIGGAENNKKAQEYYDKVLNRIGELRSKNIRVELIGGVLPNTVASLQCGFDMAINTSQTEGMSLTMSEQLYAGIPCVYPDYPDVGLGIDFTSPEQRLQYVVPVRHRNVDNNEQRMTVSEKQAYVYSMTSLDPVEDDIVPFDFDETIESICAYIIDGPFVMTLCYHTPVEWLREMTASILNQRFKCWHWVIVNDGITKPEILEHLKELEADQRVTILVHEENKNIREAQNTALKYMYEHNGNRTMIIFDSDDIAHPDLVGSQYKAMLESNKNVIGVQLKMFGNRTIITRHPAEVTADMVRENKIYPFWFMNNPGVAIWLDALGGRLYPKTVIPASSDYAMWIALLKDGMTLYNRPDVLVDYRVMGKNSTDRLNEEEKQVRVTQLELIKRQLYENKN